MTFPVPGMNPYLENPALWREVHAWLIVALARALNPILKPKYRAAVEQRVYQDAVLVGVPDVAVCQQPSEPVSATTLTRPVSQPLTGHSPHAH